MREKYSYDEYGKMTSKQSPLGTIYYQYDLIAALWRVVLISSSAPAPRQTPHK